jgi:hypothetical protein
LPRSNAKLMPAVNTPNSIHAGMDSRGASNPSDKHADQGK